MIRSVFFLILLALNPLISLAQPANDACSSATPLCSGVSFPGSTVNAGLDASDPASFTCFSSNNSVWFSFTTNNLGGNADVTLSNINCLTAAGMDNSLQAVVIAAGTACTPATYTEVSNCEAAATGNITLNATGLTPNTVYFIVIDGDSSGTGITIPAQCDFSLEVSGPAVDLSITTTLTDQTCGSTDGEIIINTVSGGTAPYQYAINNGTFQSSATFSNLTAGSYIIEVSDASGCERIVDTVVIALINGPENGVISTTDASCTANDGTLQVNGVTGGTAPYTYSLNGGAAQAGTSFVNLGAGSYTVTVTDQQGCTQTISASVANATGVSDASAASTNADCGTTNGSITITANGGTAPLNYSLNGGASQASNVFSNLAPGAYTILITDAGGCTYELSAVISENPGDLVPEITVSASPNPACVGDNIIFTATTNNGGTNPVITFFVNGTNVQSGSGTTFSSAALNSGDVVTCTLGSDDPCVTVSTVSSNSAAPTINPISNPTVTLTSSATTGCTTDQITFTATQTGCTGTSTYQWLVNGTPVASNTTGTFTSTFGGDATVSVNLTCSDPCANPATSNTVNIDITVVNANAGPDQVIAPGQTAVLNGSGGGTYSWAPGSSLSSTTTATTFATPGASTVYTLTVTENGCTDSDNVTVFVVEPIIVPNTFTPNGDGTNDTWQIQNIENFPNAKVTIYDRWGQRVYNTVGYSNENPWDGTNKGLKLPAAVYYYVIDLNSGAGSEGDMFTGSITIVL